jgi:hypothetical protein
MRSRTRAGKTARRSDFLHTLVPAATTRHNASLPSSAVADGDQPPPGALADAPSQVRRSASAAARTWANSVRTDSASG